MYKLADISKSNISTGNLTPETFWACLKDRDPTFVGKTEQEAVDELIKFHTNQNETYLSNFDETAEEI